ncbi:Magnesium transport protein CorA [compost metagenome]
MQTNKTNEIMKILTLISSIVLPLTFLTGLYGMNVHLPLQEEDHAFWILIFVMIMLGIGLVAYFKKKHWM